MRKSFLLFFFTCLLTLGLINSTSHVASSNNAGAPAGNTGSPADNKTCAQFGCHPGSATLIAGAITSDIPVTGYVPGNTYTITATVSDPSLSEFGFEISPQSPTGTLLGTMALIDPSRTKFTGPNGKYITHTTAGTSAPNHTNTWSISWAAPAPGTGDVTFYAAFNFSNNSQTQAGDVIHTSTLKVSEEIQTGIDNSFSFSELNVYPNPVHEQLNITYNLSQPQSVSIFLYDLGGKTVMLKNEKEQASGTYQESFMVDQQLPNGVYLLRLTAGDDSFTRKIVKE